MVAKKNRPEAQPLEKSAGAFKNTNQYERNFSKGNKPYEEDIAERLTNRNQCGKIDNGRVEKSMKGAQTRAEKECPSEKATRTLGSKKGGKLPRIEYGQTSLGRARGKGGTAHKQKNANAGVGREPSGEK